MYFLRFVSGVNRKFYTAYTRPYPSKETDVLLSAQKVELVMLYLSEVTERPKNFTLKHICQHAAYIGQSDVIQ
jgi:hypothetical protein